MTVSSTTSRSGPYAGAGTVGPFAISFQFLNPQDIAVIKTVEGVDTVLTLDSDYLVSGGNGGTGSLALFSVLPVGQQLTIIRDIEITQETDYIQNDPFPAESHERALDKLTEIAQQIKETQSRSLVLPVSSSASANLPAPGGGMLIGYSPGGNSIQLYPQNTSPSSGESVTFSPEGVTAVARPMQDKLREYVSAADHGKSGGNTIQNLVGIEPETDYSVYEAVSYWNGWSATANGAIGKGTYDWISTYPKNLHDGGIVIDPQVPRNGTQAQYIAKFEQPNPGDQGCWVRRNKRQLSIACYGSKLLDSEDNSWAVNAALTAVKTVDIPEGDVCINSPVTIPANRKLNIRATITTTVNPATSGTIMFSGTGSNTTIDFHKTGGFDFVSNAYNKWIGAFIRDLNGMLENCHIVNGLHNNVGLGDVNAIVVGMSGVKNGALSGHNLANCGIVETIDGGGSCIYHDNCENLKIADNHGDTCGSTFINSACGLNNKIVGNTAKNTTLFAYKGGYGVGPVITNDVAPSTTQFTVAKNGLSLRTLKEGQRIVIPRSTYPAPKGTIKKIQEFATYLLVTLSAVTVLPVVGEATQPMDTNSHYIGCDSNLTSDNTYDLNGCYNVKITGGSLLYAGWKNDKGNFPGLRTAIWFGYDNQGPFNSMECGPVTVRNVTIDHSYGSGISGFVTNDFTATGNILKNYNEGQDPTSVNPLYGGIEVGRFNNYRSQVVTITGNSFESPSGYAIYAGFAQRMKIAYNTGTSFVGIKANSAQFLDFHDNQLTCTAPGGYVYLISDDSGVNPGSTGNVRNNFGYQKGSGGYVFRCTDAGFLALEMEANNRWYADNTNTVLEENLSTQNTSPAISGRIGGVCQKEMVFTCANGGNSVKVAQFYAESGKQGMCKIHGVAQMGASSEVFEVWLFGSVAALGTPNFTSKGSSTATQFISASDFVMIANTPNANEVSCFYVNNEASNVTMSVHVESRSQK